jgi:hypothetical protein
MNHRVLLVSWAASMTGVVAALAVRDLPAADAAPGIATFDQIDVRRINVVEPDGKPRMILTNKQRFPGAIFDGKEFPHPGRNVGGGILFFNDDGTEAGGLAYTNDPKDHSAGAILTMDQYNQNEIMSLNYEEQDGKRAAGLFVYSDHPNKSLKPIVEANAELQRATTDADKKRLQARMDQLVKDNVGEPGKRVFVGKEADDALLMLYDKKGKPRLVLRVDGTGEPSIQLLDTAGKVVKTVK